MSRRFEDLTGPQVADAITPSSILLLPIGAVEQHGPHLPMSVDHVVAHETATAVVDRCGEELDVWLLPTLSVSKSNEHAWAPGTLYLRPETLMAVLTDLGRAVASTGADVGACLVAAYAALSGPRHGAVQIRVLDMLDRSPGRTMADLERALPKTWQSPTMSPKCADEKKYGVVERVVAEYQELARKGGRIAGQAIRDLVTVNGVRVTLADGTWGLVRASSNKPELVIVVESPVSEANRNAMFADIEQRLARHPEVGAYNQKI